MRRVAAATGFLLAVSAGGACSGGGSGNGGTPTVPTGDSIDLTGSWSGTGDDSSGPGQFTWQLMQSGGSFSGTFTATDASSGVTGRGSVSGTLSGTSVTFSLTIPSGGFDAPFADCNASASGQGTASASTVSATYSGTNSCSGAIASGQLSLTRQ
jgi:hypothetical protein